MRILCSLLPALLLALVPVVAAPAARPPNVVLIISDDHAWTDYGFMGHPVVQTPHLDRLAAQSLVFPRGYVPSSLCAPSLASIITGLYPHQHRMTGNEPPLPKDVPPREARKHPAYRQGVQDLVAYADAWPTLPRLLAARGYLSLQTGKWWHGHSSRGGFTHGMTHGHPDRGGRHGDEGLKIGREGLQPIFDFIAEAGDRPFFVWYAPFLPHTPHNPPERLLEKYRRTTNALPVARYHAMIEWFDETIGALLGHLDQKGLATNTLVLYVTDNGWIQEPDRDNFAPRSKRSQYDGGLRTPILLRWPGQVQPRTVQTPVQSIDIAPTILTACGLKAGRELPGVNLLEEEAVRARETIFGDIYLHNAVDIREPARNLKFRWCLADRWKLILPEKANALQEARAPERVEVELFDLLADPFERVNLAEQQPGRVAELTKRINDWWPAR